MTVSELQEYLNLMALAAGLKVEGQDLTKLVNKAVAAGLPEFWEKRPWSFRTKINAAFALSGLTDTYDLPSDFAQYRWVKEQQSTDGRQLRFLSPEEFEYRYPRLDVVEAGTPEVFTCYSDPTTPKWIFKCFPRATAQNLTLAYLTVSPEDATGVPSNANNALRLTCEKYLYPAFSDKYAGAVQAEQQAISDLEQYDTPNGAALFKIFDDTDYPTTSTTDFMSVNESS